MAKSNTILNSSQLSNKDDQYKVHTEEMIRIICALYVETKTQCNKKSSLELCRNNSNNNKVVFLFCFALVGRKAHREGKISQEVNTK